MGSPVYGKGYYDGRRSVFAELRAAANKAAEATKARKHANRIDLAASVTGSVIVQLIPVVVKVWKDRRQQKPETSTPQA